MDRRKNNRNKNAGSGPFGQLRLRLAQMPVRGSITITPADAGAADQKQLGVWLAGLSAPLKKQGVFFSRISLDDGFFITRNA